MAYTINKFNGTQLIVLEDGTIDTSTSLGLVGRNYVGYGETQNENFVFLLENFANSTPPARPLEGQCWFNSDTNLLHVYDGTKWVLVGSAVLSETAPEEPSAGALWHKMPVGMLYVFDGTQWKLIGPEDVEDQNGPTRLISRKLLDSTNVERPVIAVTVNGTILGIISSIAFTLSPTVVIPGFDNLIAGVTMSSLVKIKSNVEGTADRATRLVTPRTINGIGFDGTSNITIKAATSQYLRKGTYIAGDDFDGSTQVTWSVDATPNNTIGKVVARNSEGGFSAGTITANNFIGNVTGNVTATTGTSEFNIVRANSFIGATLTGNADTATRFLTPRNINGVAFDGSQNVTVPAAAGTLTGTALNNTVLDSSLRSVGLLTELNVADAGINVGTGNQLKLLVSGATPTVRSTAGILNFDMGASGPDVSFVNSTTSVSLGGPNAPAIVGDNTTNLGITGYKFNGIYANNLYGNADTATLATTATNIVGGGAGSVPYQTASGTTTMLPVGSIGQYLKVGAGNTIEWSSIAVERLNKGSYVNLINDLTTATVTYYDTSVPVTVSVDATSVNTANKVVARDSNGDFAAGTITANLTGNVTGNTTTATRLATPRNINGVAFDGTANITVQATDPTKLALSGGSLTGYLTLVGAPTAPLHAANKAYVDTRLPQYTFTYGNTVYSIAGYTNQVGSWNNGANYFDVFPPSGKTMTELVAFIPSIAVIHYAGGVNGDDSMRCTWANLGDRIRVWVQNTEQRSTPAGNYLAVWS